MLRLLFALLVCVVMTGCITTKTIVEKEYVLVTPEDHLLAPCESVAPPEKEQYLQLSEKDKELALTYRSAGQDGQIAECNSRFKGLRQWKSDMLKIYKPPAAVKK